MNSAGDCFGQCRLCSCEYMGPATGKVSCLCGHPPYNHLLLVLCGEQACNCVKFLSTEDVPSCYNCGHSSSTHEVGECGAIDVEWLTKWRQEGKTIHEICQLYNDKFHVSISYSSLKRKLAAHSIRKCENDIDEENVVKLIKEQNSLGVVGYHRLHSILRTQYRCNISRRKLQEILMKYALPMGRMPSQRVLHQKPFISKGPGWLWAIDGHEKLAQPYGLYIYGCIDTFSRKILSMTVLPDKKKETIDRWLMKTIYNVQGQPHSIMADKGSEFESVSARMDLIQMCSVFNQKIECLWSQMLAHSDINQFRDMLRGLDLDGHFNRHNPVHKHCIWKCFHELVQTSLDAFATNHNLCKIRRQKNLELPSGASPNDMYDYPGNYNSEHYTECISVDVNLPDTGDDSERTLPDNYRLPIITKNNVINVYKHLCQVLDTA